MEISLLICRTQEDIAMGNLYITVEEFMKQVGNSHLDIEPSVYGGAAMQISNASVSYDDEEEELTFYYGCNASLTLKTYCIDSITPVNDECYFITLEENEMRFTVTKTPEIK